MSEKKTRIYFRADASKSIGYGHFTRTLAFADMVGDDFERTFVTINPTRYQVAQIEAIGVKLQIVGEGHMAAFLELIKNGDIIVLDNYYFSTDYQKKIRNKGCKLICIDDMHDKEYVADVVINHGLNDETLFRIEPYTKLCLGLDWALVRRPFLESYPNMVRKKGQCAVAFGGSDEHNLTEKVCTVLSAKKEVKIIYAIVGDAYAHCKSLLKIEKVKVLKNLNAQEMADQFCTVEFAVLPTSTICIEAMLCFCPIFSGYYVDNQKEFYHTLVKSKAITGLDNFSDLDLINTQNLNTPTLIAPKKIEQNYKNLLKWLQ